MREFGLIGYPLGHSFSKKYFSEKFCKEGIEAGYELFDIPDLDRDTLYRLLAEKPDLVGFNVTVPYKEKIAALCDSLSEDAAAIGAVNTVRVSRHSGGEISLHGYNTDWQAFRDSVKPVIAGGIRKALVLGTGGAAKAVVYALQSLQVDVTPVSRRRREGIIAYQDLNAAIMDEHKLIVNTTPLGMWPEIGNAPEIPYEHVGGDHFCYDIVYNPEVTEFMRRCASRGASVKNGLAMLHGQAELAWKIWNS